MKQTPTVAELLLCKNACKILNILYKAYKDTTSAMNFAACNKAYTT